MLDVLKQQAFLIAVLILSVVYALLRYVVFGNTSGQHVGVFVLNKAVSMSALVLLAASLVTGPILRRWGASPQHTLHPRRLGLAALALVVLHLVLSGLILNPAYFEEFFLEDGRMRGRVEWSMLAGGLALLLLIAQWRATDALAGPANGGQPHMSLLRWAGLLVVTLGAVHVVLMGFPNWRTPGDWYGGLPPITLVSFVAAAAGLVGRFVVKR